MIPTVIDPDREAGAARNRKTLQGYVALPNYRNYWKQAGYVEEMEGIEAAIRAGVANEGGLGWDLTLSWLIKNIHVDGVQRVELISPTTNQVADDGTAISVNWVTVTNMGYDR